MRNTRSDSRAAAPFAITLCALGAALVGCGSTLPRVELDAASSRRLAFLPEDTFFVLDVDGAAARRLPAYASVEAAMRAGDPESLAFFEGIDRWVFGLGGLRVHERPPQGVADASAIESTPVDDEGAETPTLDASDEVAPGDPLSSDPEGTETWTDDPSVPMVLRRLAPLLPGDVLRMAASDDEGGPRFVVVLEGTAATRCHEGLDASDARTTYDHSVRTFRGLALALGGERCVLAPARDIDDTLARAARRAGPPRSIRAALAASPDAFGRVVLATDSPVYTAFADALRARDRAREATPPPQPSLIPILDRPNAIGAFLIDAARAVFRGVRTSSGRWSRTGRPSRRGCGCARTIPTARCSSARRSRSSPSSWTP